MSNRIKESNITPGAVTSDKIAPGTISASNITPGTITTTQIAPGTIANDRLANTGITINGTTIALGASGDIVAGTDWQSVVTADGSTATTASAGEGYFIDTTSNAHTINLPSSPSQGDEVHIVDYAGTFGTNNVTVGRNGSNIDGTAFDGTLATNRLNVRFVYIDATQGWRAIFDDASEIYGALYIAATGGTVATSGDFKIHTFTGDGCFVVSCAGNPNGSAELEYLVVAGGGGGGAYTPANPGAGGGGGAGGFRFASPSLAPGCYPAKPLAGSTLTASATTYPVTVGSGGAGQNPGGQQNCSVSGSNSVFSTITSTGGGGTRNTSPSNGNGKPGGSGGGAGGTGMTCRTAGSGNTPPVSPSQGNDGGTYVGGGSPLYGAAGGGGALAAGSTVNPHSNPGGPGGVGGGLPSAFGTTGEPSGGYYYYAGGGGGGLYPSGGSGGTGGTGGGGCGSISPNAPHGTSNTGGGGGGQGNDIGGTGGNGGKGIVVIRYKFQN